MHYPDVWEEVGRGRRYQVRLQEETWQRLDRPGYAPNREHMLMVLADIQWILIKAAHSEDTRIAS